MLVLAKKTNANLSDLAEKKHKSQQTNEPKIEDEA